MCFPDSRLSGGVGCSRPGGGYSCGPQPYGADRAIAQFGVDALGQVMYQETFTPIYIVWPSGKPAMSMERGAGDWVDVSVDHAGGWREHLCVERPKATCGTGAAEQRVRLWPVLT